MGNLPPTPVPPPVPNPTPFPTPYPTPLPTPLPTPTPSFAPTPSPSFLPTVSPAPTSNYFEGTLVAHYKLNDDALDDSGNAYHGTIAGATATTALDGGAALLFDGDDAVAFPSALTADLLGSSARTVCLWARVDAFDGGTLFSYGSIVTNQRFALEAGVAPERFYLDRFDFSYEVALAGSDVGWHHYCNAYDGATWRLYYDGTLAAEWDVILATGAANALTIGVRNGADGYLSGAVDELYVYSSALDAASIQVLYDADTAAPTVTPGGQHFVRSGMQSTFTPRRAVATADRPLSP